MASLSLDSKGVAGEGARFGEDIEGSVGRSFDGGWGGVVDGLA